MRRLLFLLIFSLLQLSLYADIALHLSNFSPVLKRGETNLNASTVIEVGSLIQILWSETANGYQSQHVDLSLLRTGEVVLKTFLSDRDGARFTGGTAEIFADSDVNYSAINNGYVWTRIWESNGGYGQYFLEAGLITPTMKEYNSLNPSTIYSQHVISDSLITIGIENGFENTPSISALGTQAIPEPSTLSFFGLVSGICILARRKIRR